jgi:hypothetical protein
VLGSAQLRHARDNKLHKSVEDSLLGEVIMPNHCQNRLTLTIRDYRAKKKGDRKLLRKLHDAVLRSELFEFLHPLGAWYTPDGVLSSTLRQTQPEEDHVWVQWTYDRALEVWGTKWDMYHLERETLSVDYEKGTLTAHFDTAWCPPLRLLENMPLGYRRIDARCLYAEFGMCFMGVIHRENGVVTVEEYEIPEIAELSVEDDESDDHLCDTEVALTRALQGSNVPEDLIEFALQDATPFYF